MKYSFQQMEIFLNIHYFSFTIIFWFGRNNFLKNYFSISEKIIWLVSNWPRYILRYSWGSKFPKLITWCREWGEVKLVALWPFFRAHLLVPWFLSKAPFVLMNFNFCGHAMLYRLFHGLFSASSGWLFEQKKKWEHF